MIMGGDGFCGYNFYIFHVLNEILIIDILVRRKIDDELGVTSLTPIAPIDIRLTRWKTETGEKIHFRNIDAATDYEGLKDAIEWFKPDTIINFAEQRAAPYSMKSATHKTYTIANNLGSNSNLLAAVTEMNLDPHIVHLGTMGVYGYKSGTSPIPEGYLNVTPRGSNEEWEILYPSNPGMIII